MPCSHSFTEMLSTVPTHTYKFPIKETSSLTLLTKLNIQLFIVCVDNLLNIIQGHANFLNQKF